MIFCSESQMIAIFVLKHAQMVVFRECKHIKNIFEDVYFNKNLFHITLSNNFYYVTLILISLHSAFHII
jgi:hypothetical protein